MLDNLIAVNVASLDFYFTRELVEDILQFLLIYGLHRFTHQFKRIAVGNRLVVVVSIDVVSEHAP